MKYILLLLLCGILFAFGLDPSSTRLYMSGSVRFIAPEREALVQGLYLFVKAEGIVLAEARVDTNDRYSLSFIPENQASFDFYYAGNGFDTTFIRSFTQFESDLMTWDIEL